MNIEIGHRTFVEIEKAWREFTSDQTWEGVRTLKDVLQKAMIGKEPDPQPAVQDKGGIVKAVYEHYGQWPSPRLLGVAQAIEAKIKGVRKLFRNHEKRLNAIAKTGVEMRVHKLEGERRTLERKVEELEKAEPTCGVCGQPLVCEGSIIPKKPQPVIEDPERSRRAQAPDSKGKLHDLIPGVSVVQYFEDGNTNNPVEGIFFQLEDNGLWAYWCEHNHLASCPRFVDKNSVTWLRDLDFPGGDK